MKCNIQKAGGFVACEEMGQWKGHVQKGEIILYICFLTRFIEL